MCQMCPMPSISISSSSSSTITTFYKGLPSSLKTWFPMKTNLEKYGNFNIYELSLLNFIVYMFASLALSKN